MEEIRPRVEEEIRQSTFSEQLQRVKTEIDIRFSELETYLDQLKAETEASNLKTRADFEKKLADMKEDYKDLLAEIDRQSQSREAERVDANSISNIEYEQKMSAIRKRELIAKAQSLEVMQLLAPLLAEGYWQPVTGISEEKKPVSHSELATYGALRTDRIGLERLRIVGTTGRDRVRPRWGFPGLNQMSEQQHDQLRKAHQYLLELGLTMVELEMLAK